MRPHLIILYFVSLSTSVPKQVFWNQFYGEIPDNFFLTILDNCLISFSFGFLVFAVAVLYQTLNNVRNTTSEPGKLKNQKKKVRSVAEMREYIFGKDATLRQMLLPFD